MPVLRNTIDQVSNRNRIVYPIHFSRLPVPVENIPMTGTDPDFHSIRDYVMIPTSSG
jgi:hypothetical protein